MALLAVWLIRRMFTASVDDEITALLFSSRATQVARSESTSWNLARVPAATGAHRLDYTTKQSKAELDEWHLSQSGHRSYW